MESFRVPQTTVRHHEFGIDDIRYRAERLPERSDRARASGWLASTGVAAIAGLLATLPMTVTMLGLFRLLPNREQFPLPPAQITRRLARRTGLRSMLGERGQRNLTWLSHVLYGALAAAPFGPVADRLPFPRLHGGIMWGLTVWTVSYLGWLPAADILPPATEHPRRRNALMITAHLVWGAALGGLLSLRR